MAGRDPVQVKVVEFSVVAGEDLIINGTVPRISKNHKVTFQMCRNTLFQKAMTAYADRSNLELDTLDFFFGTRKIHSSDTPDKILLASNDTISVHHKKKVSLVTPSSYSSDFRALLGSSETSDIVIKVRPQGPVASEVIFNAHRIILTARCPKFRGMFSERSMKESKEGVVEIQDHSSHIIGAMLEYIYTDTVANLSCEIALDLMCAADEYLLIRLKQLCEEEMCKILDVDNVASILCSADRYGASILKDRCVEFILENYDEVINSPSFTKDMPPPQILHQIMKEVPKLISPNLAVNKRRKVT